MSFNYSKLRGRIIEKFETQSRFAVAMGWSKRTLSLKLCGSVPWKQTDIASAIECLGLMRKTYHFIFFVRMVQKIERARGDDILRKPIFGSPQEREAFCAG